MVNDQSKRRAQVGNGAYSGLARPVGTLGGCHETTDGAGALGEVKVALGVLIGPTLPVQCRKTRSGLLRCLLEPNDGSTLVDGGLGLDDSCPSAINSSQGAAGARVHRGQ